MLRHLNIRFNGDFDLEQFGSQKLSITGGSPNRDLPAVYELKL